MLLRIGEKYPFPAPSNDGATANFLTKSGNILQLRITGMDAKEKKSVKSGMIKSGFLYKNSAILLLFQFYDEKGKPLLSFDAPFDVRSIPSDLLALHSISNENERLAIEIHVIDENSIIQVLRLVTMPNAMTLDFLSAVQEQFSSKKTSETQFADWLNYRVDDLIKSCENTYILGR